MKFLAYNGPYKLFHSLWVGALGAHDADWQGPPLLNCSWCQSPNRAGLQGPWLAVDLIDSLSMLQGTRDGEAYA